MAVLDYKFLEFAWPTTLLGQVGSGFVTQCRKWR